MKVVQKVMAGFSIRGTMSDMLYVFFGLILMVIMGILVGGESYRPVQSRQLAHEPESRPLVRSRESRPPAQARRCEAKRPMSFRPLRTTWSVVCFVACYLLSAFWAMTYLPGGSQTSENAFGFCQPYGCAMIAVAVLGIMPWTGWRFRLIATTLVAAVLGLAVYAARSGFPAIHY
jgi:hypothetical protein